MELTNIRVTVEPENAFGVMTEEEPIIFNPAPGGVAPDEQISYSKEVIFPKGSESFQEELEWQWEKR